MTGIVHLGNDSCRVAFVRDETDQMDSVFRLVRAEGFVGAVPDPDVLATSGLGAEEVRAIVDAVVRFCLVAQGEFAAGR